MESVSFRPRRPYNSTTLHSFTNTAPGGREALTAGTTHVAIGFLDLGSLASAVSLWDKDGVVGPAAEEGGGGAAAAGQPLRWVGYDASPYAVAKTLVVAEMMRQGAATDAVVQVGWGGVCV